MIVMFTCLVAVLGHRHREDAAYAGLTGLAISFALSVTQNLNWTVRMASDVEANMVAVERIQQYFKIQGEAPRMTSEDSSIPNWPMQGGIEFSDAKLRYRKGLPLVLKGLTINIPAKSKVGVVGRTGEILVCYILISVVENANTLFKGAGKSTLMVALLRIVELDSGSIKIDGVDIRNVGLKKLRSAIAVIPQDPVLFRCVCWLQMTFLPCLTSFKMREPMTFSLLCCRTNIIVVQSGVILIHLLNTTTTSSLKC
jgi:ATP-binding cassette subfamily C (CFTR/MRP) protein 1